MSRQSVSCVHRRNLNKKGHQVAECQWKLQWQTVVSTVLKSTGDNRNPTYLHHMTSDEEMPPENERTHFREQVNHWSFPPPQMFERADPPFPNEINDSNKSLKEVCHFVFWSSISSSSSSSSRVCERSHQCFQVCYCRYFFWNTAKTLVWTEIIVSFKPCFSKHWTTAEGWENKMNSLN